MRLSIFIGLLYVAWCINPSEFDSLQNKSTDIALISIVFILASIGDIIDILKTFKKTFL